MWLPLLKVLHALLAVVCHLDGKTCFFHQLGKQNLILLLILDNQNPILRLP